MSIWANGAICSMKFFGFHAIMTAPTRRYTAEDMLTNRCECITPLFSAPHKWDNEHSYLPVEYGCVLEVFEAYIRRCAGVKGMAHCSNGMSTTVGGWMHANPFRHRSHQRAYHSPLIGKQDAVFDSLFGALRGACQLVSVCIERITRT